MSMFLPTNSLYQSLDLDRPRLANADEESNAASNPFASSPQAESIALSDALSPTMLSSQLPESIRSPRGKRHNQLSPSSHQRSVASALLRPHTLRNDLFQVKEEEEPMLQRGRPRLRHQDPNASDDEESRAPPESLMFEAGTMRRQGSSASSRRSPSASPSRSPPPDFTTDSKGKGKATTAESQFTEQPQRPPSSASSTPPARGSGPSGLQLGGARGWVPFLPGRRRQPGLNARQRALWLWVNVDDLDGFLTDVYTYYVGKGIYCIALSRLLNLLTIGFVITFSTFLLGCIDYSTIRQKHTLSDALVDRCVSSFHPLTLLFVLCFSLFYVWRVVRFGRAVRQLWNMHEFFEELLGIPESDIQTVPWHVVVSRMAMLKEEHPATHHAISDPASSNLPSRLDAHDVANRVMRETNYMIALINRDVLDFTVPWPAPLTAAFPCLRQSALTKTLGWNLNNCLMSYLFGSDGQIKRAFLGAGNRDVLVDGLKRRFILIGGINALLAPFIVVYLLFYSFFRYFEEYHKDPSNINARRFTELAKWRFREYNELEHLFQQRLDQAYKPAQTYLDHFPKERTALISRFVAFVAGSFASVLILFSILDPDAFLHFEITKDRSVLFYITIFGSILAVARGMIPEDHRVSDPEKLMLEVAEHTHWMPDEWRGRLHSTEVLNEFSQLFQMKITTFAAELFSVLTTPFVFWFTLPDRAPFIIDFFREFTIHVDGLGYVCSFGVFDFKRGGGDRQDDKADYAPATNEAKLDQSVHNFRRNYPEYSLNPEAASLYLSQNPHPAFGRRSTLGTRFGAPMASTTFMGDASVSHQPDQDYKSRLYEQAFQKAGARSVAARHGGVIDERILEEGLEESYGDTKAPGPTDTPFRVPDNQPVDSMLGLVRDAYSSTKNKGW